MGTVSIKAAILRKDHEYFGDRTALPTGIFFVDNIRDMWNGFLVPPSTSSDLGSPSYPLQFIQANGNVPSTAKVGTDFYDVRSRDGSGNPIRYTISCNSAELAAALESTDAQNYVALPVATGSGYTLQG